MKALTTRINEYTRKIAKKTASMKSHDQKALAKLERGQYSGFWETMAEGCERDIHNLKAECYALLLERIKELETENAELKGLGK